MKFLRIKALFQDIGSRSHNLDDKNDNSSGKTVKAARLTELDDQLCGGKVSYEAESFVVLHETEQDRRYISRAIVVCALAR